MIDAVLAAGRRGVKVRILSDTAMAATYPETLARFQGRPNIQTRLFDWKKLTGGILHAKYFIVDGSEAFVGSQNFDWRALTHIQETGLRIRVPLFARALQRIFDADWGFSGGDTACLSRSGAPAAPGFLPRLPASWPARLTSIRPESARRWQRWSERSTAPAAT